MKLLEAFLTEKDVYDKLESVAIKREKAENLHTDRKEGKHRSFRLSMSPKYHEKRVEKLKKKENILSKSADRMDKLRGKWQSRIGLK